MIETISKKDSFIIYKSFFAPISSLSFSDRGLLFTAIFEYQINQKIIDMPPQVKMAFMFFKNQFDLDFVKWEKICLKRSNAGKQGGRPSESKTKQKKQMLFKKAKEAENENENENVLSKDNNKKRCKEYIYNDLINEFSEYRKKIKKPMTEKAKELADKKLFTLAGNNEELAKEIVEQSIFNNWTGLFELKNNNFKKQDPYNGKTPEQIKAEFFKDL